MFQIVITPAEHLLHVSCLSGADKAPTVRDRLTSGSRALCSNSLNSRARESAEKQAARQHVAPAIERPQPERQQLISARGLGGSRRSGRPGRRKAAARAHLPERTADKL